jgi:hypothetical protein
MLVFRGRGTTAAFNLCYKRPAALRPVTQQPSPTSLEPRVLGNPITRMLYVVRAELLVKAQAGATF